MEKKFMKRLIVYDDPRLTRIIRGYVLQAIFYHVFGQPFCTEKTCMLYNAHWQEEVLTAQLRGELKNMQNS